MKNFTLPLLLCVISFNNAPAQTLWTESDRKYLLDNLSRTRDELLDATKGLTEQQWTFKEADNKWSINQVVEHITLWELLNEYDISKGLNHGPQPQRPQEPDSLMYNFIHQGRQHNALDYTKPFAFAVPLGLNSGKSNLAWLLTLRKESIDYIKSTKDDLRLCFGYETSNIHQTYIGMFGHVDRHLRQIRKIKQHPLYPK